MRRRKERFEYVKIDAVAELEVVGPQAGHWRDS